MRIARLDLSAFGHFTGRALDFGTQDVDAHNRGEERPDFHLLPGPNEAGKSTILAAIADLLFGIEAQSRYRFLHDNALSLAAVLEDADGARLEFRRRKGIKNTVLDPTGAPMDENRLGALLRGCDRAFFTGMFGLDHERLRRGGEDILSAKGDLGQSLFQAGAAIGDLRAVLTRLDDQARTLFVPQGRNPAINRDLAEYERIRKTVAQSAVDAKEWSRHERACREADEHLAALRREHGEVSAERSRLERIHRVLPLLARRQALLDELKAMTTVPVLPDDAPARRRDAQERLALARRTEENARGQLDTLGQKRAALTVDRAILDRGTAIDALHRRLDAVAKDREDLPRRQAERQTLAGQVRNGWRDLGTDLAADMPFPSLPPRLHLAQVPDLIAEGAQVAAELSRQENALLQARQRAEGCRAELERLPTQDAPRTLRETLRKIRQTGDPYRNLTTAHTDLTRSQQAIAAIQAALPPWAGTAESLAAAPCPTIEEVREAEERLRRTRQTLENAQAERRRCEDERRAHQNEIDALTASGEVATEAAVTEARRIRDRDWRKIRRHYVEGLPFDDADAAAGAAVADDYENAVSHADSLADRVKAETQRAARLEQAAQNKLAAERRGEMAQAAVTEAERADGDARIAWAELWRPSGLTPASPPVMMGILETRKALVTECANRDKAQGDVERWKQETAEAERELRGVLNAAAPNEAADLDGRDFETVLARAETLGERLEQIAGKRETLTARLEDEQTDVRTASERRDRAEATVTAWRGRWAAAMTALRLPAACEPAQARATVDIMTRIGETMARIGELDRTIADKTAAVTDFETAVDRLVSVLSPDLRWDDALDVVARLSDSMRTARENQAALDALNEQIEARQDEIEAAGRQAKEASAILALLCRQAGCADEDELESCERQSVRRREIERDKADQERLILENGDGLSLAGLMDEAAQVDPDGINGLKTQLLERLATLDDDIRKVQDSLAGHKAALDALSGGGDAAAQASQECERLAADIRDNAAHYIRLRLGHVLLRQAVETYRKRHQGPLMERAGQIFRRLTREGFTGLDSGFDARDEPVLLAVRADGRQVGVEGLSEGTRDQLFLSLRIAVIEGHLASGRVLPFIADDLLIHFDDERAGAAFAVLAELSLKTQVLFFTHNQHMVDLARRVLPSGSLRVQQV